MKKHLALVSVIAIMITAMPALADGPSDSWYMSASGDITKPQNSTISGTSAGKVNYGFSSGGDLAVGYDMSGFRSELEFGYHALGIKSVTVGAGPNASSSGDMKIPTLMINAYYDFHNSTRFTPYVGGGLGAAHLGFPTSSGFGNTGSSDNRFAYQAMTGLAYTPESMPATDWSVGYRYLGASAPQFTSATGHISADAMKTHSLEFGFRYHF